MSTNTVLTELGPQFDVSKIIVSDAKVYDIPNSPLKYQRAYINIENPDGTVGNLVFPTPRDSFSSGIVPNKNDKEIITGFSLPISLRDRDGETQEQKNFITAIESITEHVRCECKKAKVRKIVKSGTLDSSLIQMNPLKYRLNEEGVVDKKLGASMYIKLLTKKTEGGVEVITPLFKKGEFTTDGNPAVYDITEVVGGYALVYGAVRLESVYFGSGRASLQFKLMDVDIGLLNGSTRQTFTRQKQVRPPLSVKSVEESNDKNEVLLELSDDEN